MNFEIPPCDSLTKKFVIKPTEGVKTTTTQWRIQNLALGGGVQPLPLVLRGQFRLNYNNFVHRESKISEHMAIFKKNIYKFFKYLQSSSRSGFYDALNISGHYHDFLQWA